MKKYIFLAIFMIILLSSCPNTMPGAITNISFKYYVDKGEITPGEELTITVDTINFGEDIFDNLYIFFSSNALIYNDNEDINYSVIRHFNINNNLNAISKDNMTKIDNNTVKINTPTYIRSTSEITIWYDKYKDSQGNEVGARGYYKNPGSAYNDILVKVKYPEYLTLQNNNVKYGDIVTITSEKPFLDVDTFTETKKEYILNNIPIIFMFQETEQSNGYIEPVHKVYYKQYEEETNSYLVNIIDISPYMIKFKIPSKPYLDGMNRYCSGKIYITNERGIQAYKYINKDIGYEEWKNDCPIVSSKDEVAYYSTKEELIILDESGDVIR
ncbi:MAG: hypothetical protein KA885_02755 [Spirochaetes bacterium]|nr:hypothetical protein [Spirochaetota bacterium]